VAQCAHVQRLRRPGRDAAFFGRRELIQRHKAPGSYGFMYAALAVTSFANWQKRLGKNWKRLHQLIYFIEPLAVLHFVLVVKGDVTRLAGDISQPLIYGASPAILLGVRVRPVKSGLLGLRYQVEGAVRRRGRAALQPGAPDKPSEK
jgi:hypothetical protein